MEHKEKGANKMSKEGRKGGRGKLNGMKRNRTENMRGGCEIANHTKGK